MISHEKKTLWMSIVLVLLVDQITKGLVDLVWVGQSLSINQGFSFGFKLWSAEATTIFLILMWFLMGCILLTKYKDKSLFIGLFLGGGLSNIIDRLFWGGVRDWISWPVTLLENNLADLAIAIGLGGLLIELWFKKSPAKEKLT